MLPHPHRTALCFAAVVIAVWTAAFGIASRSAPAVDGAMVVVFRPDITSDDAFAAITRAGGQPLRQTWLHFVWLASSDAPDFVPQLTRAAVFRSFPFMALMPGCAWSTPLAHRRHNGEMP